MSFSYANPTSGPSAGGIGWFNFGTLSMMPGDSVTGLTGTLNNGNIVTFDMALSLVSGAPRQFNATTVPTFFSAQFGVAGYTGISGNVAMYAAFVPRQSATSQFTISNITVKTPGGDNVPNYSVLIADAESTNLFEGIGGQTNGGPWGLFASLGAVNAPVLTGVGTQTFDIVGNQQPGPQVAYVLSTQAPGQIVLTLTDQDPVETRQGFSIGFATTRIQLQKYVAGRIDDADQFALSISGAPAAQATTAGVISGLQSQTAEVYATPGNPYGINESMAPGSVSLLSDYTTIVSASNATPAGSAPPVGSLPVSFTPALGDDVTYTLYNAIPETYAKTVDKAYADIGELLTYTVSIDNPNDFPANNVLFTDPTPFGTTYIGNLQVSAPYTGIDPNSGLVITSIPANGSVSISWQVRINTVPPIPTPVVNVADIVIPGGNSGMTNLTVTDIRTAYVTINKMVDKTFAQPGEVLTYTLTLNNAGNVVANNVIITDTLPAGVSLVPGSLTGASGAFPTLTLNAPLAAGGIANVSYQVKIGNGVPSPNPIPNIASAVFQYTVDPTQPGGKSGAAQSNTVTTLVQTAKLSVVKNANRIISYLGDTITYQLAVTNTGNLPADNVVITDVLTAGTVYVPGSLVVSVPATGDPTTAISLTNPLAAGQTVSISFKATVAAMPNPNPILNMAKATFTYTVNPGIPDGESGSTQSNTVVIPVLRNNLGQPVNDVIETVAQEQAALAAIANAEGAKIQRMAAMSEVTPEMLLCLNKSVADIMESIAMLEAVLRHKLGVLDCQISGETC